MEANITNSFGFILKDNISKWGENFVQDQPNYTFEELEQVFANIFELWIMTKNFTCNRGTSNKLWTGGSLLRAFAKTC